MTISQVITTLPTAPDPSTMTRDQFSTAAAASVLAQKAMVPEINTWTSQVNAIVSGTAGDIASGINSATAKTTPVDADLMTLTDSATSFVLKKLTWANLKATLGSTFASLAGSTSQTFSVAAAVAAGDAVRLEQVSIGYRVYTASSSYSKATNNPTYIIVDVIAGGGQGSGQANGFSGSSGGYGKAKFLTSALSASETITIGAGGTTGTSNTSGQNGGTSSFGTSPGTVGISCGGGSGGGDGGAAGPGGTAGAVVGAVANSAIAMAGGTGNFGGGQGGIGASSQFGAGGCNNSGGAAPSYGAGGGSQGVASTVGGAGGGGIIIIHEFR